MIKFRCSSLYKIMTKPRSGGGLSETAKTHIKQLVIEDVYGVGGFDGNRYTRKGQMMEDEAIRAIGLVTATMPKKHEGRLENDWLTGECDLLLGDRLLDTKCSWSADTFPWFKEDAAKAVKESGYDWQMRGYMWLYDRPASEVVYVLLPTPVDLLGFNDDPYEHTTRIEDIPLKRRIQRVLIERDESLEAKIAENVELARAYMAELYNEHPKYRENAA